MTNRTSEERRGDKRRVYKSIKTNTYGELNKVKLTEEEYTKLLAKHGVDKLKAGIEILDSYIASKNVRYASHYAVLKENSWVWDRVAALPQAQTTRLT